MCQTIRFPDGLDVESINDFERVFEVDAEDYKHKSYGELHKDCCMCPLDLEKFLAEHPEWKYEFNGDYWMNENYYFSVFPHDLDKLKK